MLFARLLFAVFLAATATYGVAQSLHRPPPAFELEMINATVAGNIHSLLIGVCCVNRPQKHCWEYMTMGTRRFRRPKIRLETRAINNPVAIQAAIDNVMERARRACLDPA